MPIIDVHTHAFPDSLAPRAMEALQEGIEWRAIGDGTIAGLLRAMDAARVDASVICNIATKPSQVEPIFGWCRQVASSRIIPFASIHPTTPDLSGWLGRFADAGLRGIKMHPMYQEFAIDEERMDPLYAAVAEAGLVLEMHCGSDIAFPGDTRADVCRIASVVRRHPTLKFLCTHLGGWQQWDAVAEHLIGKDVWIEVSMTLSLLGTRGCAELIRGHDAGKVLFGTDWPWTDQIDQINLLRMLNLPREHTDAILGGNAARLLGLTTA